MNIKEKLYDLWIDFVDALARIEMRIKYLCNKKFYEQFSEDDIPKKTFYCYEGCRMMGFNCPFLDWSFINQTFYCHYVHKFDFTLLSDQCKICGIGEDIEG